LSPRAIMLPPCTPKKRNRALSFCKREIVLDYADYTVPMSLTIININLVRMTTITLPSLSIITGIFEKYLNKICISKKQQ
jgi:hypothetical protein